MPPKPKLHKNSGKVATIIPKTITSLPLTNDPEAEQQFQVELCWCIQQLQTTLNSGKLNPKQGKGN